MDVRSGSSSSGAQLLLLRGNGRPALTLPISPARLLLGFVGAGLCPAFCIGLLSSQMGLSGALADTPRQLRAGALMQGLYAAQITPTYEVLPRAFGKVPDLLPPPPTETVEAVDVSGLELRTPESRRGQLRVLSLHLGEHINIKPFSEDGTPDPEAFATIAHLWRCRVTDHEAPIEPKLIRLLTTLSDIYDRPVHLVSGHRVPDTLGTKPTSQHAAGTAADIRIPGVSIDELRSVVVALGGRGVGLYSDKGFVHVDLREKSPYFWVYRNGVEEPVQRVYRRSPAQAPQEVAEVPAGDLPAVELADSPEGEDVDAPAPPALSSPAAPSTAPPVASPPAVAPPVAEELDGAHRLASIPSAGEGRRL